MSEIAPDFVRLHERAAAGAAVRRFGREPQPGACAGWTWQRTCGWSSRRWTSPRPAGEAAERAAGGAEAARRAWIFTSATLGDDARLSWFTEPCGLARGRRCASAARSTMPTQARCLRAARAAQAERPGHSGAVARLAPSARARWAAAPWCSPPRCARCRHRRAAAARASRRARHRGAGAGQWPKRRLIERFRESARGAPGCVLVARHSFWEGMDVPGEALQLVMIDKLPFPPPNDPLVEARRSAWRRRAAARSTITSCPRPRWR